MADGKWKMENQIRNSNIEIRNKFEGERGKGKNGKRQSKMKSRIKIRRTIKMKITIKIKSAGGTREIGTRIICCTALRWRLAPPKTQNATDHNRSYSLLKRNGTVLEPRG